MTAPATVASPPTKPLLLFDGDCNFCRFWIRRWQTITGDRIDYLPFQEPTVAGRFPELNPSQLGESVHLVEPSGQVSTGAAAVFRSLASNPRWRWPLLAYGASPLFAGASEWAYGQVAQNRTTFSLLTRVLWGSNPELPRYQRVRWLFLRSVSLIYLLAFVSLWVQVDGLIGHEGILPADEYMTAAGRYFESPSATGTRWHAMPTLCWISAGNAFLHTLCAAGVTASLLLLTGVAPALSALALWILYLSLCVVGRDFLSFQWDALLLETGFLCIFLAPFRLRARGRSDLPVPRVVLWLLRWLLFRLMFESGCVKLLSGDLSWQHLTALDFHYETQPLPTWIAWYAHQLPSIFHKFCVVVMFGIELALPFFIFSPRRLRIAAGFGIALLQLWILLTGNYGFFNYLTLVLCLALLDDAAIRRWFPGRGQAEAAREPAPGPRWQSWAFGLVGLLVLSATTPPLLALFRWQPVWLGPASALSEWLTPFRTFNRYGLFAVMTTSRPEIVVEGSNDGQHWLAYTFKYKPGAVDRRPRFVAPHQPRLDWQMWFAALGTPQQNPWFVQFCSRLLTGSPDVLALLEKNPFPTAPPKHVRAVVYEYHFRRPEKGQKSDWWQREPLGTYLPSISKR